MYRIGHITKLAVKACFFVTSDETLGALEGKDVDNR